MTTCSRILLPVALLCAAVRAQEGPLELRRVFSPGQRWAHDEELALELSFAISHQGQVLQTVEQKSRKLRKYEATVLEVAGGKLAAVRAVYAAESECGETERTGADAPQKKPCGLAGQTVTVRRQASDPQVECAGTLSEAEEKEVQELLDPSDGFLPAKPVRTGDEWAAQESAVRRALDLGSEDTGTLRLKLASVREVAGRKIAVLVAAVTLEQKQDGLRFTSELEGVVLIDAATGNTVGLDLHGPMKIGGEVVQADEDGNEVRLGIEGTGKLAVQHAARWLGQGQAAPAAPAQPQASSGAGSLERQGKASFTLPPGWKGTRYTDGLILAPSQHGADADLQVLVMLPLAGTGTPAEGLRQSWDDVCAKLGFEKTRTVDGAPYSEKQGGRSFRGWEYLRGEGTVRASGQDFYLNLMAIKLGDRFERVAVYGKEKAYRGQYPSFHDPRLHDAIQELLFSFTFDDCPAPDAPPGSLKGAGIVGAWSGAIFSFGELKQGWAVFFDNGQALFSSTFPLRGFDGANTRVLAEMDPRGWGTWRWEGESGSITMPYTEVAVRQSGPDLKLNTLQKDRVFERLPSVDGARFDGTYELKAAPGDPAAGKSITFSADGRYTDAGAITILNHTYPLIEEPSSGTYEVKDHTMTLRASDGRVYRIAMTGVGYEPGNTRPSRLVLSFNVDVLIRR